MAKLLYFLENETIENSQREQSFTPALSHDAHLIQMVEAASQGGHEIYIAPVDNFGPDAIVTQLLELSPFNCAKSLNHVARTLNFDLVFTAYPDLHQKAFFPGAKTVGYFPALYFVEMPDHFLNGRMYYLLRSIQKNVNYFVFQNERQADFLDIFTRSLAGIDIRPHSYIMPYGVSISTRRCNEHERAKKRALYGIGENDVVLLHGGGAWRWTDFERFLAQYIHFVQDNPSLGVKLIIPGLSQKANTDHNSYVGRVHELILRHQSLLKPNKDWKILYEPDWEIASTHMFDYYAISDIGISTSPNTLEYHLSHRVRVMDYISHGLGLLLSYGDKFSTMPELSHISFIADSEKNDGYSKALEQIFTEKNLCDLKFLEAGARARSYFRNGQTKLELINRMLHDNPDMPVIDCPINHVFNEEKVTALSGVIKQLFESAIPL